MNIVVWSLIGIIIGSLGAKFASKNTRGFFPDLILGILGAVESGYYYQVITGATFSSFSYGSVIIAICGGVALLALQRTFSSITEWSNLETQR